MWSLLWGDDEQVIRYYRKVEELAGEIRDRLPTDSVMITISDHGIRLLPNSRIGGRHSYHSFMSVSHHVEIPEEFNVLKVRQIIEMFMKRAGDVNQ